MKQGLLTFLKTKPLFVLLLPVFFVLHGYVENYEISPGKEALTLLGIYLLVSILLAFIFWLIYKDIFKACFATFIILAFNFFFGSTHDFLKSHFNGSFITRYSFILPVSLVFFIALVFYLKKTRLKFLKTNQYLNWLFIVLIFIDVFFLITKLSTTRDQPFIESPQDFVKCDTCSKPDVYLIIADEYAGHQELKDLFNYDNTPFENELRKRGFHVVNHTKSNYNATVYSMASMLNLGYIENMKNHTINATDIFTYFDLIAQSNVVDIFNKLGYTIYNNSFFDLKDNNRLVGNTFFNTKNLLFISQTFAHRFFKDIGYHFENSQHLKKSIQRHLYNNKIIDSSTKTIAKYNSTSQKFVYTHLQMPHHPYFFDQNGKEVALELLADEYKLVKGAYIEYLIYTNRKLLQLIDHIKISSKNPPLIILMSDHGFRQFSDTVDQKYHFMNLNAILLPNGDYSQFYDGMSNVNQFRVILNSQFGQKLPLLKDSTTFLLEE